ncbi:MAG TPA: 1-deoxy-D-xylulose-5-phosphate reductoisomerase [Solirubrobacterales bacterium]|nr:1-deoxy-D-xylulose-5-phosphate reductoisomerase [Solirubrobacterales bacterium]
MKKVLILGSTGSIGTQALDVIERGDALRVVGLSAGGSDELLVEQAREHGVPVVALAEPAAAERAGAAWKGEILAGQDGVRELIERTKPDLVLNAIVGSAGLGPTIATLSAGIDLALANKESLVVGGELVTALAEAADARIIPVDSEHSALHQLIAGEQPGTVTRLVLTASGGPFRGRTDLGSVTREQALDHPTWDMGGKITIDSATLMNKGLELIEAHHLFGIPYERIDVVVHPQSLIHSLVHLNDGASLAHLGHPDMRVPISYALNYPERADAPVEALDLAEVGSLTFERPDTETFRCLALAREAGAAGGTAPCVLNAANEIAVEAFLAGRVGFAAIAEIVETTLSALPAEHPGHFEDLFAADASARERAREAVEAIGPTPMAGSANGGGAGR